MASNLGGKVGTRFAEIANKAKLDAIHRAGPIFVKHGMAMQHEFFRLTGSEIQRTYGPAWRKLADHPEAPDWLRDTANFLADGDGQLATLLAGSATSALIGGGIAGIFTNWLQPLISANLRGDPNSLLAPSDVAQASIRGLRLGQDNYSEAANSGLSQDRFQILEALASQTLDPTAIMILLNRGLINTTEAQAMFTRAGWLHDHSTWFFKLRESILSVADAAAMINRDIITEAEAHQIARSNGYSGADMDRLSLLGGEPPDLQSLVLAWRRNIITESDVDRGLVQGPLRKEWIPVVKALQWQPLPVEVAASAVNQGHMTLVEAQGRAAESGITPEDFAIIVENSGLPPGPQEALDWVSRGTITEQQFREIFLESRIKNKYIDLYLANRTTLLTMAETRGLFAKGAMTHDQAITRLVQRGYTPEDAGIILAGASAEKTATVRDMTVAQVVALYKDRIIGLDAALSMITAAGYSDQEAQWFVDLADVQRVVRFTETAISKVHSEYVTRHIDESQASSSLDTLHVPPAAKDDLMALWALERGIATKELTTAEVISAVKAGVFTNGQGYDKLQGQGYSASDALVKLKIAKQLQPDGTAEDLTWPNR